MIGVSGIVEVARSAHMACHFHVKDVVGGAIRGISKKGTVMVMVLGLLTI